MTVSYTHLDVYKRQYYMFTCSVISELFKVHVLYVLDSLKNIVSHKETDIISGYVLLVKMKEIVYISIGPQTLCFLVIGSKQCCPFLP